MDDYLNRGTLLEGHVFSARFVQVLGNCQIPECEAGIVLGCTITDTRTDSSPEARVAALIVIGRELLFACKYPDTVSECIWHVTYARIVLLFSLLK